MFGVRVLYSLRAWHELAARSGALRHAASRLQLLLAAHSARVAVSALQQHVAEQQRLRCASNALAAVASR